MCICSLCGEVWLYRALRMRDEGNKPERVSWDQKKELTKWGLTKLSLWESFFFFFFSFQKPFGWEGRYICLIWLHFTFCLEFYCIFLSDTSSTTLESHFWPMWNNRDWFVLSPCNNPKQPKDERYQTLAIKDTDFFFVNGSIVAVGL